MLQIEPSNVQMGAQAASKESAIRQVAELLVGSGCIEPGYAESMLAREQVANTYLGKGVAIPHGLPKDRELIQRTGIAVLQVPAGVAWQPGETRRASSSASRRGPTSTSKSSAISPTCCTTTSWSSRLAVTRDPLDMIAALSAARREVDVAPSEEPDFDLAVDAAVAGAHGLHARPATAFVETAKGFDADVLVRHGTKTADGKSLGGASEARRQGGQHGADLGARTPGRRRPRGAEGGRSRRGRKRRSSSPAPRTAGCRGRPPRPCPGSPRRRGSPSAPCACCASSRIVVERTAQDPERERERLRDAIAAARAELQELYQDVAKKSGKAGAAIFLAHAEFLADPGLMRADRRAHRAGAERRLGLAADDRGRGGGAAQSWTIRCSPAAPRTCATSAPRVLRAPRRRRSDRRGAGGAGSTRRSSCSPKT